MDTGRLTALWFLQEEDPSRRDRGQGTVAGKVMEGRGVPRSVSVRLEVTYLDGRVERSQYIECEPARVDRSGEAPRSHALAVAEFKALRRTTAWIEAAGVDTRRLVRLVLNHWALASESTIAARLAVMPVWFAERVGGEHLDTLAGWGQVAVLHWMLETVPEAVTPARIAAYMAAANAANRQAGLASLAQHGRRPPPVAR